MYRNRTTPLWLVLPLLALRAFVPDGYMPAPLAEGVFVPCPGAGPGSALFADHAAHHGAAGHGEDVSAFARDFCFFGAGGAALVSAATASPAILPAPDAPVAPAAIDLQPTPVTAGGHPRAPPRLPARMS